MRTPLYISLQCLVSLETGPPFPSVPRLFAHFSAPPPAGSESHDHPRKQAGQPRAPKPLVPDRQLVSSLHFSAHSGLFQALEDQDIVQTKCSSVHSCPPPPPQSLLGYSCSSARSHCPGQTASTTLFPLLLFPAFALCHPLCRILPIHVRAIFLPPSKGTLPHLLWPHPSLTISDCFWLPVIIQILSGQSSQGVLREE